MDVKDGAMSPGGLSGALTRRRYTQERKAEAFRLVRLRRAETGQWHGSVIAVAHQLGYGVESVRNWVHQAETDAGERPGTTTVDAERIKRLEQENRELRRANEILNRASAFCAGGVRPPTEVMVRFIEEHRDKFVSSPSAGPAIGSRPSRGLRCCVISRIGA